MFVRYLAMDSRRSSWARPSIRHRAPQGRQQAAFSNLFDSRLVEIMMDRDLHASGEVSHHQGLALLESLRQVRDLELVTEGNQRRVRLAAEAKRQQAMLAQE